MRISEEKINGMTVVIFNSKEKCGICIKVVDTGQRMGPFFNVREAREYAGKVL